MSRNTRINLLLLLAVAALAVLPLALGLGDGKEEPFAGSDGEAETAITEIEPDYEPWFAPLYEPPSGEIESALFSLQAAIGTGFLAYYFGLRRGRRQGEERARAELGTAPEEPAGSSGSSPGNSSDGRAASGSAPADAAAAPSAGAPAGPGATGGSAGRAV
ncbi:energy-coupling factor ABC transporter substrate-binding protein [Streptomyces sp. NPDC085946]|uniref:energy-coupling factor ABC transporter substrate-binding protein n=1 Tax=Streptomyces sp. NPDC085946 TaxID=3365744 RepID=UPI0037CD2A92